MALPFLLKKHKNRHLKDTRKKENKQSTCFFYHNSIILCLSQNIDT